MKNKKGTEVILQELRVYLRAIGYQQNTQRGIALGVKAFLNWMHQKGVEQLQGVDRALLLAYQEYLETRPNQTRAGGLSSKMIRDYLWTVQLLFNWQEQQGKLSYNPMSSYELPKAVSQKRSILSKQQVQQLYQACSHVQQSCVLHLYYGLGLRRTEGEQLNLQEVDYRAGWVWIKKGKGGRGRKLPLTPQIQADLKSYILEHRPRVNCPALLLNSQGRRYRGDTALQLVKQLAQQANIQQKVDLHSLRHSIATHLLQGGMSLLQVRDYLGHKHLESTQHYLHYDTTRLFTEQIHAKK